MRRPVAAAALAVALLLTAGCSASGDEPAPPPSEVTGVVVAIDGEGSTVSGFTVDIGGERYELRVDPAIDYGFDLGHLRDHQATRDPVRVPVEQRGNDVYALAIHDA